MVNAMLGRFTLGITLYPPTVYEVGRTPGQVWTHAENLASPGIDARTVQSVAYRLTDYAIPAHLAFKIYIIICYVMLRHVTSYHVMLHYIILYIMGCYAM